MKLLKLKKGLKISILISAAVAVISIIVSIICYIFYPEIADKKPSEILWFSIPAYGSLITLIVAGIWLLLLSFKNELIEFINS